MKVFLGGTVNKSKWRDKLIPQLDIEYFNPVVEEWNDEAYQRELYERQHCDFCLYVITPKMTGYYALAEVTDDSFKRPDRTLYCYLKQDEDSRFDETELKALDLLGEQVKENGGNWLHSLDEIAKFLNSGKALHIVRKDEKQEFDDVFISYGRRHSKSFATKLHDTLISEHYAVWFDQNDIPLGVDFQEQINEGISRAHNFVFIISPHAIRSEYCLKEIELAVKLNKRIIPLMHVEPVDEFDNIHPAIAKINWIYIREEADENKELYEWKQIDDFDVSFQGLLQSIGNHASYVEMHTSLLVRALQWEKNQRAGQFLLVGKDRQEAEKWLAKKFLKGQPPCIPTDLHCEFICESKKNGENLMTEAFIAYAVANKAFRDSINKWLSRYGITTWVHTKDIKTGQNFEQAIKEGVAQADNFILFLSKESLNSDYCKKELDIAIGFNKRIIPILTEPLTESELPDSIRLLQYIDFSEEAAIADTPEKYEETNVFLDKISRLITEIQKDKSYYQKHKKYLAQAIKWNEQSRNESLLLRGYNLQDAEAWLEIGKTREVHLPTSLHDTYITASGTKRLQLSNEVFISYSRADSDFARKLNDALQLQGKTTWFDQESIASGVDFQEEIYRGIESSDNFLFVISPEAIKSPYCADEVEYAASLNKRFITIMHRRTDYLHPTLAAVQWIDFEKNDFDESFNDLISVVDLDREYVQQHTKWSQRALTWDEQGQNQGLLLTGLELETATKWLKVAQKETKKPIPTSLLIKFIHLSETATRKENQRKLILTGMVAIMAGLFMISGALAFFAFQEKKIADHERIVADSLRINAQNDKILADSLRNVAVIEKHAADSLKNIALVEKHAADSLRILAEDKSIALQMALKEAEQAKYAAFEAQQRANQRADEARANEERANVLAQLAEQRLTEAEAARQDAEKALAQYEEQKIIAEEAQVAYAEQKATVDKMTMLSAASQLATVSKNEFNNGRIIKAKILALHAYFLNREHAVATRNISTMDERDGSSPSDTLQMVNNRFNESTGNIPAIFEALTNTYFYDKQDTKIGSKSPITTFDITNEPNSVRQLQVNPVRLIAAGDESGQVFIYRSKEKRIDELINSFNLKSKINCIKFNEQSDALLIGTENGEVYLLRDFTQRKSSVKLLKGNTGGPIISVNFFSLAGSDQLYGLTANENKLIIWAISETKGRELLNNIFETKANNIRSVDVSVPIADNTLIAVASGELTNIYKIINSKRGTPQLQQSLSIKTNYNIRKISITNVSAVAFSKDGKRLATAYANGNIETWETKQFSQLNSYFGHTGAVHALAFSNDGNRLVSGGEDQTLRIWDKQAIEEPLILKNENSVYTIGGTKNLKDIISLRNEHFLRFWPTHTDMLVKDLCDNTPSSELIPLQEVFEYAGTSFTYRVKNCVYR